MTETEAAIVLDLKGLKCPLPVLRARKALKPLDPGARLDVIATDPMAVIDIAHMCHEDGHRLIEVIRPDARQILFRIERGPVTQQSPDTAGKA
jgi:tRNA 2-thiouridine synthesizing protein A